MKRIFVDLDDEDFDILNRIVIDGNHSAYIRNFLKKELFSKLKINNNTPPHIQYYEEVEKLMKLLKLRQQEIADQLGFSQAAIAKSFKMRNERSVIYRAMTQHGSPDNFVYDMYVMALYGDDFMSIAITSILGETYDYLNTFIEDYSTREYCVNFIMKLNCFYYRTKPKQYDASKFMQAIKKLDKKLFLNFDKNIVEENEDRSAERLYTSLTEYYLSLEL